MGTANPYVDEVAKAFVDARLNSRMCELPDQFRGRPQTESEGYAIQEAHVARLRAHFECGLSGYKVGFTRKESRPKWRLGMESPTYGGILSKFTFEKRGNVPFHALIRPAVECEMAVRIGQDLPPSPHGYDRDHVMPYIGHIMAGIELVDVGHISFFDFTTPLGPLVLADNCCNWGVVIGEPVAEWRDLDLPNLRAELWQDGKLLGTGKGGNLGGDPIQVVVGLENHLLSIGKTLRAGEIIMLGSVIPHHPIAAPCEITVDWDVLGRATAVFA